MEITKQTQEDFVAAIKSTLDTYSFFQNCEYESFELTFRGYWNCESKCRVHFFSLGDSKMILFEDIGIGTSVTNASEHLADEVVKYLGDKFNEEKTVWMECYPYSRDLGYDIDRIEYTYDPVLKRHSVPRWTPIKNAEAIEYIQKILKKNYDSRVN